MGDDLKSRGPADRSRVNVHEAWELTYWSKAFRVTPEEIKAAVKKVGPAVEAVEKELNR